MRQADPDEELAEYLFNLYQDLELENMEMEERLTQLQKDLTEARENQYEALNMILRVTTRIENLEPVPYQLMPILQEMKNFLGLDESQESE